MTDPTFAETYPHYCMLDADQEREDALAGILPEPFGAELARRMNANPDFTAWAAAHVTITDLDGRLF